MKNEIIVKTFDTCPVEGTWVALGYPGLPVSIDKGDIMPVYGNIAVPWKLIKPK